MTVEAVENVVQLPESKKRLEKRPKIEAILPIHIVEVAKLAISSMRNSGQTHPDITEDSDEHIRSHLFAYLQRPHFVGLLARMGKKPVGVILGHVILRPFGRPSRYVEAACFWVEPNYRNQKIGMALWKEFSAKLKTAGIYHWEAHVHDQLLAQLLKSEGVPVQELLTVIGGRM